ncbi:MAG: hypothetical protein IJM37_01265 [Lachnospiraceae bacterium]|nr:hypothetical protein [Lachnospiraceae bacterium]
MSERMVGNSMKRFLSILLTLIVLLSGCGKSADTDTVSQEMKLLDGFSDTQYNPETDSQYYWKGVQNVMSVKGKYYMNVDGYLYCIDAANSEMHQVCSKGGCRHNTADCDSYLGDVNFLQYYDGYFYYIIFDDTDDEDNKGATLYRRTFDGLVEEMVCRLFERGECYSLCIHRGYVYFSLENDKENVLYRMKPDKASIPEELFTYDTKRSAFITGISGYGDGVLIQTIFLVHVMLTNYSLICYNLYYYDNSEDETYLVKKNICCNFCNYANNYAIADDKLYYFEKDGVYQYDISSKKERLFYPADDERLEVSYDGRYLYFDNSLKIKPDNEHSIYVFDTNGKHIDTISVPLYSNPFGDTEYLFYGNYGACYVLDKKQIGSRQKDWTKFLFFD